jgi:hypothetical protein
MMIGALGKSYTVSAELQLGASKVVALNIP